MLQNDQVEQMTKTQNTGNSQNNNSQSVQVDVAARTQFTGINEGLKRAYGQEKRQMFCYSVTHGKEMELKLALSYLDKFGTVGQHPFEKRGKYNMEKSRTKYRHLELDPAKEETF